MAVETVFLVVLVTALSIGNVLLSFIPNSNSVKKNELDQNIMVKDEQQAQEIVSKEDNVADKTMQAQVFYSNFSALNQKLNILSHQFERLETKARKVDNFRANSEVEIKAMKEIIIELQKKYLAADSKKVNKSGDLSTSDMHKIIYKSD